MIVSQEPKCAAAMAELARFSGQPLASLSVDQLAALAAAATDIASQLIGEKVRREVSHLDESQSAAIVARFRETTGAGRAPAGRRSAACRDGRRSR